MPHALSKSHIEALYTSKYSMSMPASGRMSATEGRVTNPPPVPKCQRSETDDPPQRPAPPTKMEPAHTVAIVCQMVPSWSVPVCHVSCLGCRVPRDSVGSLRHTPLPATFTPPKCHRKRRPTPQITSKLSRRQQSSRSSAPRQPLPRLHTAHIHREHLASTTLSSTTIRIPRH